MLVSRLFHRALGAIYAIAWLSLLGQVRVLVGARGLLPAARWADRHGAFWDAPTLFRWIPPTDAILVGGCVLGALLGIVAAAGRPPRLCLLVQIPLYLSYTIVCRDFFSFQWDSLLLECGLVALALPWDRPSPLGIWLVRLLLLKLYVESGVAKWQSWNHDWRHGTAMVAYYETAPIPTVGAWFLHQLPAWWHALESWATLVLELAVPWLVLTTRRLRLGAALALTAFQLVNLATANYGFFVYLALALHIVCVDEDDLERFVLWLAPRASIQPPGRESVVDLGLAAGLLSIWLAVSLALGAAAFVRHDRAPHWAERVSDLRLVDNYHLFGSITTERIEPDFQTSDGAAWTSRPLRWKPGPVDRAPPFVAPDQPRVDFDLWFHGLSFRRYRPEYVEALIQRLCRDPGAVQPLFVAPLPARPRAVRIVYWRYRFTTPAELWRTGAFWSREEVASTRPIACDAQ